MLYRFLRGIAFVGIMIIDVIYDTIVYLALSASLNTRTQEKLKGRIIAHYHILEKGLSLRNPRKGFGKKVVKSLCKLLRRYISRFGTDDTSRTATEALQHYGDFNSGEELADRITKEFGYPQSKTEKNDNHLGGTKQCNRGNILSASQIDLNLFLKSRHSVRQFDVGIVNKTDIEDAIKMAQQTPSVCNRQPWRVLIVQDPDLKLKLMNRQTGTRGFGNQVDTFIVVFFDRQAFFGPEERNEGYVDAGMFGMTLTYALHSKGYATCCLNCCTNFPAPISLCHEMGVSLVNQPVMIIAVGNYPENFSAARSTRRPLSDVILTPSCPDTDKH